jgi:hypothetical protein
MGSAQIPPLAKRVDRLGNIEPYSARTLQDQVLSEAILVSTLLIQ